MDKRNEAPGQDRAAGGLWLTWSCGTKDGLRQAQAGQSRAVQASGLQASGLIRVPALVHSQSARLSQAMAKLIGLTFVGLLLALYKNHQSSYQ